MAMDGTLSAGDIMALTKDNDGLFGGGAGGILALIIVFILLFGGNGMWGNRGEQYATQQGVQNAFDTNTIVNKIDALGNGICDLGYANANLINGVNTTVMQSANDIGAGITALGYQFQNCCCENLRNQDSIKFDAQLNTRDITNAIHEEGQATRALITENTIQQLREDLQSAQLTLANASQTQNLLSAIGRYVTNPPCYANYTCGCNSGVTIA